LLLATLILWGGIDDIVLAGTSLFSLAASQSQDDDEYVFSPEACASTQCPGLGNVALPQVAVCPLPSQYCSARPIPHSEASVCATCLIVPLLC
jgi:hypothetical protein